MNTSLSAQKKKTVCHLLDSLLSGAVVLYASFMIRNFDGNKALLSGLFLLLAAENAIRPAGDRRARGKRLCLTVLYLAGAALILALEPYHAGLLAAAAVEFAVLLCSRIAAVLKKPDRRTIEFNALCILLIVLLAVFVFGSDLLVGETEKMDEAALRDDPLPAQTAGQTEPDPYGFTTQDVYLSLYLLIIILWRIILHVVGISVTQMKLNILLNIVRETYVLEILLGLVLMIIVCSTVFATVEEGMAFYGDALWYCFALVTTIGFGDITAKTWIGRGLSVFLGIYGIVVIAIITSVIVNFYGEMRRMTGQKPDAEKERPGEEN